MPPPSLPPPSFTLEDAEKLIMHDRQVHQYYIGEERSREQFSVDRVSGNPGVWHENLVTRCRFKAWIIRPDKATGVCDHEILAIAVKKAYELAEFEPPPEILRIVRWYETNGVPFKGSPFPPPPEKKR